MSRLTWDKTGERVYEAGADMGVLYLLVSGQYSKGVAFNGLTAVNTSHSGGETDIIYADDMAYAITTSTEEVEGSIEAYTYPHEFSKCLGKAELATGVYAEQQRKHHFGFSYRSLKGNDIQELDYGYIVHLLYDVTVSSSDNDRETIGDSVDPLSYSWDFTTTPVIIEGMKPTAEITLDYNRFVKAGMLNVLHYIEDLLYGTSSTNPKMPSVGELTEAFPLQIYLRDSAGNELLDDEGNNMQSFVVA